MCFLGEGIERWKELETVNFFFSLAFMENENKSHEDT